MGKVPASLRSHTFKKGGKRAKKRGAKGGRKSRPTNKK